MLKFIITFVSIPSPKDVCHWHAFPFLFTRINMAESCRIFCEGIESKGTGRSQILALSETNPHVFLIQPFAQAMNSI